MTLNSWSSSLCPLVLRFQANTTSHGGCTWTTTGYHTLTGMTKIQQVGVSSLGKMTGLWGRQTLMVYSQERKLRKEAWPTNVNYVHHVCKWFLFVRSKNSHPKSCHLQLTSQDLFFSLSYKYKSSFTKWTHLVFCLPCDEQDPCLS